MRFGRYAIPYLLLRISLGLTFLWIGVAIFRHPDVWLGYLPNTIPFDLSRESALQLGGIVDLTLGALLITGHFPRLVAWLASLHLAGIIVSHGLDAVVIRDVGLLGSALTLALWPYRRSKHRLARLFGRTKKSSPAVEEDE